MGARFEGILLEQSGGEEGLFWTHVHSQAACSSTCSMGGVRKSSLRESFCYEALLPNLHITQYKYDWRHFRKREPTGIKEDFHFHCNSKDTINDQCPGFDIELSTRRKVWPRAIAVLMV